MSCHFFKSLLRNNSHSHPLIYLSGIHSTNLSLVLDYIYQGEVQIHQEDLENFLDIAEKLKIDGLVKMKDLETDHEEQSDEAEVTIEDNEAFETDGQKQMGRRRKTRSLAVKDNSEKKGAIEQNLGELPSGVYHCKVCHYVSQNKFSVRNHIETHIEGLSYSCSECHKTFRSSNSLKTHKSNIHKF